MSRRPQKWRRWRTYTSYIYIYTRGGCKWETIYNIIYTSYFPIAHKGKPCLRAWIPVDMNWWFGPFINYLTYHRRRRRVCEYIMCIDSSSSRRRGRRRVWRAPGVREKREGGGVVKKNASSVYHWTATGAGLFISSYTLFFFFTVSTSSPKFSSSRYRFLSHAHTPHSISVCAAHSFYSKLYTTPRLYTHLGPSRYRVINHRWLAVLSGHTSNARPVTMTTTTKLIHCRRLPRHAIPRTCPVLVVFRAQFTELLC